MCYFFDTYKVCYSQMVQNIRQAHDDHMKGSNRDKNIFNY